MVDISNICEKVFYINMEESKDRNESSLKNLGFLNLPIERIEAVTPKTLHKYNEMSIGDIPKRNLDKYGRVKYRVYSKRSPRWKGDICCGTSHAKAILEAKRQGLKKVMICEDDFVFLHNEAEMFMENIGKIPPNFDVMHITSLLHGNYNQAFKGDDLVDYKIRGAFLNDFVFRVREGLLGTGAYIINLENESLIETYVGILKEGAISDCLMAFHIQENFNCYTTRYKLGYQDYLTQTVIGKKKGEVVNPSDPRIKWLMKVTFNTIWTIIENSKNPDDILKHLDNKPIF